MNIEKLVKTALHEDLGRGDLFSQIITNDKEITAKITAKSDGVFAGEPFLHYICKLQNIDLISNIKDGDEIKKGEKLATLKAKKSVILLTERVLLNFLQHASGIATLTAAYKKALCSVKGGEKIALLDTRKTRPGLREFEKYATRCGGGNNHRMGLDDMVMLKDTHLEGIEDWGQFLQNARKKMPIGVMIEIECDDFNQVKRAASAGADILLLDNMSAEECAKIVAWRNENYPYLKLEASGNITLESIKNYANCGVERISVGATIHQATWLDFSMRLDD